MSKLKTSAALVALMLVSACATGPNYAEVSSTIPPVDPGMARIYFYRDGLLFGMAVQPDIYIRGRPAVPCAPASVSYLDLPPGRYRASVSTEVDRHLDIQVQPGETRYVRCYIGPGIFEARAHLELVAEDRARSQIGNLTFGGTARAF